MLSAIAKPWWIATDLAIVSMPYTSLLQRFRHLREEHDLTQRLLEVINDSLTKQDLFMCKGSNVDATIVTSAFSNKNQAKQRDLKMKRTKKDSQYMSA